jgi:PPOX class probable F420-dependent enzyme
MTEGMPAPVSGHIPWSKLDAFLKSFRSIWISTTRPDGRPHATPVWYLWDGQHIYFTTSPKSQKGKDLAHQSWVIVHAGDPDDVIILEGPAQIVIDKEEQERVNAAYGDKYVDPNSGAKASIFAYHDDLYRVEVKHVMAWEYGNVRNRTDWRFN